MELALTEIADILSSGAPAADARAVEYSIDSRTIRPGALFFAIRGPRFDGHDFVEAAFRAGAVGAVVEKPVAASGPVLRVPDTTRALATLAAEVRRRWGRRLIGVTGSAGKTTTKEMIAAVLGSRFRVLKSEGNLNNQYGLPLCLLRLTETHDMAVIEMGMSRAGEIAELARIAHPDDGVVTCVAPVHLEYFDGIEGIARAKRELIDALPATGTAVLNADDPLVLRFGDAFEGYPLTFGIERPADFRACDIAEQGLRGVTFCLEWEGECVEFRLPLIGQHNVLNALAAVAMGHTCGVSPRHAAEALAGFHPPKMRGELLEIDGVSVVNDCYNSNPHALGFMLRALACTPAKGRRVAVLGEMLELGASSPDLHRAAGRQAGEAAEHLVAVRGNARYMIEGAAGALPPDRMAFFDTAAEAGDHVASLVQPGDVVLFKASRGVRLEEAVERLSSALHNP